MVTLKDISRETGKSVTQVSRALGGHEDVKPQTRKLIEDAANRLGYRPNTVARGLKTGRSGIVAMVVAGDVDASAREIMFEIVTGISAEISRQGMKFLLHVCQPGADEVVAHDELYRAGGIDGFVLLLSVAGDPRVAHLLDQKIPFFVHGFDPTVRHPGVDVDNYAVGQRLAQCLTGLGHRRIAFLSGPQSLPFATERVRGFMDGAGAGADVHADYGEMTVTRGLRVAREILSRPDRPTAIVAGNTMLAEGIYQVARSLGLRIPQDLSVLAHDDGLPHYVAAEFDPPVGGTRSTQNDAWKVLAAGLTKAIRDGVDQVGPSEIGFEFDQGRSVAPPNT